MAQQLIFTSAVAGLNPGSSGYCTVARSESMREAVAARLEQWSVYAHAARGPRPVVCAHRILNLRGSSFHVLTRIVDSGLDYTGRTNFLAHHLVLQPHEIHGACSPAEVFSNWKGWLTEWEGAPRYLEETSFSLHAVPRTTRLPASAWAEAAGDAGAAALLLTDGAGQAAAKSVDLIVPAGFEKGLLRLFAESLYLADPVGENAPAIWGVPFTTFLQVENDPADFRWRGFWPEDCSRATGGVLCDFVNGHIPPIAAGLLADHARFGTPKTAGRPNIGSGDSPAVVARQQTISPNLLIGKAVGTPRNRRPSARTGSASDLSNASDPRGVPRWVWIILLFAIPLGITGGWFFGRRGEGAYIIVRHPANDLRQQPDASKSLATSPPQELRQDQQQSDALHNAAESTGQTNIRDTTLSSQQPPQTPSTVQANIIATNKSTVDSDSIASATEVHEAALRGITQTLSRLPKAPVFLSIGSVQQMSIPGGADNPLARVLQQCSVRGDAKGVTIAIYYENPFMLQNRSKGVSAFYKTNENELTLTDEGAYEFSANEIRSTSKNLDHDFVWITLNSTNDPIQSIQFVLANTTSALSQHAFRLSPNLISVTEKPLRVQVQGLALQPLEDLLNSWTWLEAWKGDSRIAVTPILTATLAGSALAYTSNQSDFQINFEASLPDATSALKSAEKEVVDNTAAIDNERKKQSSILHSQQVLGSVNFSSIDDSLAQPKFRPGQNENGAQYYALILLWLKEIGGDNFPRVLNDQSPSPQGRLQHMKELMQQLSQDVSQNPRKLDAKLIGRMQALISGISNLLSGDNADFFAEDSISPELFSKRLTDLQNELKAATIKQAAAEQRAQAKIEPSMIREVGIDAKGEGLLPPVHLIQFNADETLNALKFPSPSLEDNRAP